MAAAPGYLSQQKNKLSETKFLDQYRRQQESRLTVRDFCSNDGISASTFYYCVKKVKNKKLAQDFIPLVVSPPQPVHREGYVKNHHPVHEITEMGFKGEISQARYNINKLKEQSKISTSGFSQIQSQKIPYIRALSSGKLAKYIGSRLTEITDHYERYYLQTLLDNIVELRIVRKLVQIFKTMFSRGRGNIKRWIDFIIHSKRKLSGLKTFARGMLRDIEAVENGINMSWSNGAVEGHVNRIKSIKRQMYGRASFELLRKKVILSQTG